MKDGEATGLTLSAMTMRTAKLAVRIQAAAAAGFQGIGWRLEDFEDASEHDLTELMEQANITPQEVEFFRDWVGLENDPAYQQKESALLRLAGRLKARRINVAVFERESQDEIITALTGLCRRASEYDLIVQLEFMPYDPSVPTLAKAWEIVQAVGEPNAGLLLDAWHWARSPGSEAELENVPPERVTGVQLSGHLPEPMADMAAESRHHRLVPGADCVNFLNLLRQHEVSCPVSVEVMSDDLDRLPPAKAAVQLATDARLVLRKATWQSQRT